jgi:3-(3-hydroxy-phenyl)propionate hydroxylase
MNVQSVQLERGRAVSFDYDVVVCGYGPCGQATASLLARLGLSVLAIDKHPRLYGMPRLCTINGEPIRIIALAGHIDRALSESSSVDVFEFRAGDGEMLAELDWSGKHPSGYGVRTSMYQPNIEDAMHEAGVERGVEVRMGWVGVDIEQDVEGVTFSICERDGGELNLANAETVRTRYLIGADGAKSFVREHMEMEREDFGYLEAFLSVDVKRKHDLGGRFRNVAARCDPGRTVATIPMGEHRIRFEFIVNPDDDHSELLKTDVGYKMIEAEYGLTGEDIEIYRQVVFPFEGKLANQWRNGKVLILGDAAHLMPPFLGEGAGSGLRDALNLVWKLDLVMRGVAGEEILDSYQTERRPHVETHVLGSIALAELACERDAVRAAERNENYRTGNIPPPPEEPTLEVGILHKDQHGELQAPVGHFSPQDEVELDGKRGLLDDVIGWGFTLLAVDADPLEHVGDPQKAILDAIGARCFRLSAEPRAGALIDVTGTLRGFLEGYGAEVVLIRPDFYVFGAGSLEQLPALVEDLAEQLGILLPVEP